MIPLTDIPVLEVWARPTYLSVMAARIPLWELLETQSAVLTKHPTTEFTVR